MIWFQRNNKDWLQSNYGFDILRGNDQRAISGKQYNQVMIILKSED